MAPSMRCDLTRPWWVRAGIDNVLNRQSPTSFGSQGLWNYGTKPMYANIWGRTLKPSSSHPF